MPLSHVRSYLEYLSFHSGSLVPVQELCLSVLQLLCEQWEGPGSDRLLRAMQAHQQQQVALRDFVFPLWHEEDSPLGLCMLKWSGIINCLLCLQSVSRLNKPSVKAFIHFEGPCIDSRGLPQTASSDVKSCRHASSLNKLSLHEIWLSCNN